jgi:putative PIN family toxin of toxin-antitoxin system
MLRVVADANVLISAALARSPQAPSVLTLDAALDGRIELVTSPLLLREVAMVLARPRLQKYLSAEEAARFLSDLAAQTTLLVDSKDPPPAVCRDPRDDYLVALATSSGAEAIVTGDLDLLAIDPDQLSFEVLTPRQLTDRLSS